MAADWYYVSNQQQAGPVSLDILQQMLRGGALSTMDLVFGPGMSQWLPAGQVSVLSPMYSPAPAPRVLGYGSAQMGPSGLSPHALETMRQTGPWMRFMAVMMFIGIGLAQVAHLAVRICPDDSAKVDFLQKSSLHFRTSALWRRVVFSRQPRRLDV